MDPQDFGFLDPDPKKICRSTDPDPRSKISKSSLHQYEMDPKHWIKPQCGTYNPKLTDTLK